MKLPKKGVNVLSYWLQIVMICLFIESVPAGKVYDIVERNKVLCALDMKQCPRPNSTEEMEWASYCFECPVQTVAMCVNVTGQMVYFCSSFEDMSCNPGIQGIFELLEHDDGFKVMFKKVSCNDGFYRRMAQDCRFSCLRHPYIDTYVFSVLIPASVTGAAAIVECNKERDLCSISHELGARFNYTNYFDLEGVCVARGPHVECVEDKSSPTGEDNANQKDNSREVTANPSTINITDAEVKATQPETRTTGTTVREETIHNVVENTPAVKKDDVSNTVEVGVPVVIGILLLVLLLVLLYICRKKIPCLQKFFPDAKKNITNIKAETVLMIRNNKGITMNSSGVPSTGTEEQETLLMGGTDPLA